MFLNTHLKDLINQDKIYLKRNIFLAMFYLHEYNLLISLHFFLGKYWIGVNKVCY